MTSGVQGPWRPRGGRLHVLAATFPRATCVQARASRRGAGARAPGPAALGTGGPIPWGGADAAGLARHQPPGHSIPGAHMSPNQLAGWPAGRVAALQSLRSVPARVSGRPPSSAASRGSASLRPGRGQTPCHLPTLLPGCAAQRDFCDGVWCQNGGTCVSGWNAYFCRCPLRFGGKNCEHGEGLRGVAPGAGALGQWALATCVPAVGPGGKREHAQGWGWGERLRGLLRASAGETRQRRGVRAVHTRHLA